MKKDYINEKILILCVFTLVGITVFINFSKQKAIDRSKIPEKVEMSEGFQRWLTNLKNKDFDIEADEFRLQEENEIYNTIYLTVHSIDEPDREEIFWQQIESHKNIKKVIFSPSERQFIDYRYEVREGYPPEAVHYLGLRDDKIVDCTVLICSRPNCYFDRAYFLNNNVFVISELSRNVVENPEPGEIIPKCSKNELCEYTFRIHVIDLINNSRLVYESDPLELVLDEAIPEL